MRTRIELTPEADKAQLDLATVLNLGEIASGLRTALNTAEKSMRAMCPVEAPEGWCILVEPKGDETPLPIDKLVEGTEESERLYIGASEPTLASIAAVRKDARGYLGYIGKTLEFDEGSNSFYVYDECRKSRVWINDGWNRAYMPPLEQAERRYPDNRDQ